MFGSTILDVAIGIIFIYLLVSLVISAINELSLGCQSRATNLRGYSGAAAGSFAGWLGGATLSASLNPELIAA
jgi:hypothetical protein